ncbi:ead/Ea22-like family protein [Escherichia coli]|nr:MULTISPECIES: ead/Ea22-like family protein [Enterobacteriaceae]EAT2484607.1 ead/Ea22-like family protein [Salmonella enterica]EGO4243968.1 ead/Ea22-like family protein [Escherichia coli]EHE2615521.1 ead/Ea22-like family protein [Escherichia coli]EIJ2787820.1 ead/Ea22-like family protein [Escherichia coli]MBI9352450.1 ead/Ea22-like family protein [Escherichia coli]
MSEINYQALREAAQNAKDLGEIKNYKRGEQAVAEFESLITPRIVLALLDERERNQQYIKRRDQENEDIALTVGKLLIENGQLVADTLRHLADNEIDSDYFAITSTNENGTEIDHEMSITDYALQAAGTVDELVAALEAAKSKLNEQREYYEGVIADGSKRIAELEAREIKPAKGEVLVVVSGFTGCGKSAIAGEIEIAMKAIGVPVKWTNGDAEKRMTGADWLTAIEMYKPTVRIVEVNVPRAAGIRIKGE